MLLFAFSAALAGDVVLRNDLSDSYDSGDQLAWLEFPECAVSVLKANAADLPLEISYVEFMLASNTGNDDGETTLAEMGIQLLADGAEPVNGPMDWGPEEFTVTVSSTSINRLTLVDETAGWTALPYSSGQIAVWICPPDPTTGESWPRVNDRDESGIVIDTSASPDGSYIFYNNKMTELGDFIQGSWVVHAGSGEGGGGDTGTDTGDTDTGVNDTAETDSGEDSGENEGILSVQSVTPNSGMLGETVTIAVLGQGFETGAQVYVGGMAASGVSLSGSTALSATTPSALPAGTHDVMVTNPGGDSSTLAGAFTVEDAGCGCDSGAAVAGAWAVVFAATLTRRRRG
ncbi:hypothetical protein LBMAG42_05550 [Deltaproteobacteria bacterium]|nr:hypothetical protein LBMAG42_05550 [Deltaproteobacteria bacterium]